jgi:putative hydrolase of the HAD superfamily
MRTMANAAIRAVLWDFGGVITDSPFDAFRRFEQARGLPADFLRRINAANPDDNAWARFERSELTFAQFDDAFAHETAAAGHRVGGAEVVKLLYGAVRPEMVEALREVGVHYMTACLTNNVNVGPGHGLPTADERAEEIIRIMAMFDHVIESRKVGVRKPEPRFYEIALAQLGIEPREAVYLDDLGVNLKPARAMGMTTIKVDGAAQALAELEAVLGLALTTALSDRGGAEARMEKP